MEVQRTGDDRLKESGFDDWVVTLRPLTGADETPSAVNVSAGTMTLEIAVGEQPDLPPQSFVQTSIIDVIDQTIHTPDDEPADPLRDEGGEA